MFELERTSREAERRLEAENETWDKRRGPWSWKEKPGERMKEKK